MIEQANRLPIQTDLALLFLSLDRDGRAWKSFDWDAMNRLYEKGYIGNPVSNPQQTWRPRSAG
ncbi:DUF6429 family protein [Xanthobacter agilis]|uniref:DUF6429 family protein n=1 Tax=Xanthobacter agilis TaxID=47492 RepID=UPI00372B7A80